MNTCIISFQPIGKKVVVKKGSSVFKAALENGIEIPAICGGDKLCGKCLIKIPDSLMKPTPVERKFFSDKELVDGFRLACKTFVHDDTTIWLVNQKEIESIKILTTGVEIPIDIVNDLQALSPDLQKPTLENQLSIVDSIRGSISESTGFINDLIPREEDITIPYNVLKEIPEVVKKCDYKVSLLINGKKLSEIRYKDNSIKKYGIAVDLGTTTIVGLLIDLESGETLNVASRTNPQVSIGGDVVTRANFIINNQDGLEKLHKMVINAINEIIAENCSMTGIDAISIHQFALAGNAVMNHIFLKVDPEIIAFSPYLPVFNTVNEIQAADIGLIINPLARVFILPNISGYVGGDIVGLIISHNLLSTDKMTLALDLGTNGEIVLGSKDKLLCCATAAGPAFEGGHISSGMRAARGAVDKVSIYENILHCHTIENSDPAGICGTGLVDLIAELLENEVIDETGRILGKDELSSQGMVFEKHILSDGSRNNFSLFNENSNSVILKQQDVRELQLAKGAIRAGISILMSNLGIQDKDIDQILIAGAFGSYINKESAQRIGLIPKIDINKVKSIGNSASIGAKQYLLSLNKRIEALDAINKTEYIELCNIPEFQDRFMEEMLF